MKTVAHNVSAANGVIGANLTQAAPPASGTHRKAAALLPTAAADEVAACEAGERATWWQAVRKLHGRMPAIVGEHSDGDLARATLAMFELSKTSGTDCAALLAGLVVERVANATAARAHDFTNLTHERRDAEGFDAGAELARLETLMRLATEAFRRAAEEGGAR